MASLVDKLRRKSHEVLADKSRLDELTPNSTVEPTPQERAFEKSSGEYQVPPGPPPGYSEAIMPAHDERGVPHGAPQLAVPGAVMHSSRPPPGHNSQQVGGNIGMGAGMIAGIGNGGPVGADMWEGEVAGNLIGQRIGQAQKHAYFRDQALDYREQLAAGTIQPGNANLLDDGTKQGRRAAKRAERWERRAARRD